MKILFPYELSNLTGEVTGEFKFESAEIFTLQFAWNPQWPLKNTPSPKQIPPGFSREDFIWKSTCFEAFIKPKESEGYWEINMSPLRKWNAYVFKGHRQPQPPTPAKGFEILEMDFKPGMLRGKFSGDFGRDRIFQVGLTCVLETVDSQISHWALIHAEGTADFHNASTFILERELK